MGCKDSLISSAGGSLTTVFIQSPEKKASKGRMEYRFWGGGDAWWGPGGAGSSADLAWEERMGSKRLGQQWRLEKHVAQTAHFGHGCRFEKLPGTTLHFNNV